MRGGLQETEHLVAEVYVHQQLLAGHMPSRPYQVAQNKSAWRAQTCSTRT